MTFLFQPQMLWPLLETNKQNLEKTHKQIPTPPQPKLKPKATKQKPPNQIKTSKKTTKKLQISEHVFLILCMKFGFKHN